MIEIFKDGQINGNLNKSNSTGNELNKSERIEFSANFSESAFPEVNHLINRLDALRANLHNKIDFEFDNIMKIMNPTAEPNSKRKCLNCGEVCEKKELGGYCSVLCQMCSMKY